MAVPKRKTSKSRKNKRRGGSNFKLLDSTVCPHCHKLKPTHRICPYCGYYDGKAVMEGSEG